MALSKLDFPVPDSPTMSILSEGPRLNVRSLTSTRSPASIPLRSRVNRDRVSTVRRASASLGHVSASLDRVSASLGRVSATRHYSTNGIWSLTFERKKVETRVHQPKRREPQVLVARDARGGPRVLALPPRPTRVGLV